MKIRLTRPLQEVQDIGELRPLWNKEDFYRTLQWWKLQRLKTPKSRRIWRPCRIIPDLYDLGRHPLWNLADYGSCQYPRSRCIGERPEHGELKTQSFAKENPKAGDINYGMIDHGNDKSRNTAIHDVIARLWYFHRVELSMHMHGRIGW